MKSYELNSSKSYKEKMAQRMGYFFDTSIKSRPYLNSLNRPHPDGNEDLSGIYSLKYRFGVNGGYHQQERMIQDKRRSLDRSLIYSYQGANIKSVETGEINRALINPDKLKQDYDMKILSVPFEAGYKEGDIFEWVDTDSYWLIYLQDKDEYAYFRSQIRRCQYEIEWEDEDGRHSTYAAVRGPVETKIDYIQKHGISVDNPNYSLNILLPRNKETLEYFRRYSKFYLQGEDEGSQKVCWRVEAIDWISTPGILEINATEYYINETEDNVEEGIVGGLVTKPVSPNDRTTDIRIEGEVFIKPKITYEYRWLGAKTGRWKVDTKKYPVKIIIDDKDSRKCSIKWVASDSGQFELTYGDYTKTIVVESLF